MRRKRTDISGSGSEGRPACGMRFIKDTVFGRRDGALTGLAITFRERANIFHGTRGWKLGVIPGIAMLPRSCYFKPSVLWQYHLDKYNIDRSYDISSTQTSSCVRPSQALSPLRPHQLVRQGSPSGEGLHGCARDAAGSPASEHELS